MTTTGVLLSARFLYDLALPLEEKMRVIAREIYGADDVSFSEEASASIERFTRQGFAGLPVCMAKTHLSLTSDPTKKGAPTGFTIPITRVRASVGAGFIYPLIGTVRGSFGC